MGSHANSIRAVGPQEWRGVSKTGWVAQLVSMPSSERALSPGRVRWMSRTMSTVRRSGPRSVTSNRSCAS